MVRMTHPTGHRRILCHSRENGNPGGSRRLSPWGWMPSQAEHDKRGCLQIAFGEVGDFHEVFEQAGFQGFVAVNRQRGVACLFGLRGVEWVWVGAIRNETEAV